MCRWNSWNPHRMRFLRADEARVGVSVPYSGHDDASDVLDPDLVRAGCISNTAILESSGRTVTSQGFVLHGEGRRLARDAVKVS